jgi:hypothetical protein
MKRELIIEIEGEKITIVKCEITTRSEFMRIVKELSPTLKSLPNNSEKLDKTIIK